MRKYPAVDAMREKASAGPERRQSRDVAQPFGSKRFLIAASASERHHDQLAVRLYRVSGASASPRGQQLVCDRQSGEFQKCALGESQH